jgi:hypothetical protein
VSITANLDDDGLFDSAQVDRLMAILAEVRLRAAA